MEAQREPVERISAVTLLTVNMVEAVAFYEALGFHLLYGGLEAPVHELPGRRRLPRP